ncbi:MAG: RtcB family protein [Pirellulaceae bacterium]|nr:RtcB family protein [Pirellulaceae bacterium]
MTEPHVVRAKRWVAEVLSEGLERQLVQLTRQPDVAYLAVMPDVHQGKRVPNGVVVATRYRIYPDLVGADIGCGYAAIRFHAQADELTKPNLARVLDVLGHAVPTLKQPVERVQLTTNQFSSLGPLSCETLDKKAAREGRYQLGTLGRGNHFLELARDPVGNLWGVSTLVHELWDKRSRQNTARFKARKLVCYHRWSWNLLGAKTISTICNGPAVTLQKTG